jgi:hypothetical protein
MIYTKQGKEIRPRHGLTLEAGCMVFRDNKWETLKSDHIVVITTRRDGLCQSVEREIEIKMK